MWNEAQTEARLSVVGADVPVSFTNEEGQALALDWAVPNVNDCRGCHARNGQIVPIGPSARNLNRGDQLEALHLAGVLNTAPQDARARRMLMTPPARSKRGRGPISMNCGHCHNPAGPRIRRGSIFRGASAIPRFGAC